jgi:uncharacterized protein YdeI (YjbR/CyaY-like superfamily)
LSTNAKVHKKYKGGEGIQTIPSDVLKLKHSFKDKIFILYHGSKYLIDKAHQVAGPYRPTLLLL